MKTPGRKDDRLYPSGYEQGRTNHTVDPRVVRAESRAVAPQRHVIVPLVSLTLSSRSVGQARSIAFLG